LFVVAKLPASKFETHQLRRNASSGSYALKEQSYAQLGLDCF